MLMKDTESFLTEYVDERKVNTNSLCLILLK